MVSHSSPYTSLALQLAQHHLGTNQKVPGSFSGLGQFADHKWATKRVYKNEKKSWHSSVASWVDLQALNIIL